MLCAQLRICGSALRSEIQPAGDTVVWLHLQLATNDVESFGQKISTQVQKEARAAERTESEHSTMIYLICLPLTTTVEKSGLEELEPNGVSLPLSLPVMFVSPLPLLHLKLKPAQQEFLVIIPLAL